MPLPASRTRVRAGCVLSGLAGLFLLFDSAIKFTRIDPVVESFARLGYAPGLAPAIGVLELACVVVYVIPRTSVLGAVLLTGFLGGATATHVRVGSPLVTHVLFPIYVGGLVWGGLVLREERLRALLPLRRTAAGRPAPERAPR
jgi:hypothetical protein